MASFSRWPYRQPLQNRRRCVVKIRAGDLSDPVVLSLLGEHLEGMAEHSPPESIHALDVEELKGPGISFWTIWDGADLCGCGALKELDMSHGEIKSMRTAAARLRKGAAAAMLEHIIDVARRRGYSRLSLETWSGPGFDAALHVSDAGVVVESNQGFVHDGFSAVPRLRVSMCCQKSDGEGEERHGPRQLRAVLARPSAVYFRDSVAYAWIPAHA